MHWFVLHRSNQPAEGNSMILRVSIFALAFLILAAYEELKPQSQNKYGGFDLVDKAGNIRRPADGRDLYQLLGTYTVELNPKGEEMHVTYASPGAAQAYRKNGKFTDGTVLVKEVFDTDHAAMTTGDAHWASDTKVWFVMIKDEKNRYPNNPLWGDGWGWALFNADAPDKQVATNYKKDCLGCHIPASQTTGYTYKVIRSSNRNNRSSLIETHLKNV